MVWQRLGWEWGTGLGIDPFSRGKIGQVPTDSLGRQGGPGQRQMCFWGWWGRGRVAILVSPGAVWMKLLSSFQASSPVCTELEMHVMDWLAKMLGLPEHFLHHHPGSQGGGVLQVPTLAKLLPAWGLSSGR